MIFINEDECEAAGVDPKKVASIARRIERAALEAYELGICIFGGSGNGSLRFDDHYGRPLILVHMEGCFDGGDGAEREDETGLLRGE